MEEKRNKNIMLLIIAILLFLILLVFGYYTFFVKSNNNNNKNNSITKESDVECADYSDIIKEKRTIYEIKGNMGVFINNPTKVDLVEEAVKAKVEKSLNDLTKEEWQQFILTRAVMFATQVSSNTSEDCDKYPSGEDTEYSMKCILGITDDEMKKANVDFFKDKFGGSIEFMSFNLNDIKNEITKIYGSYGNIFSKSFDFGSLEMRSSIFYDAKVDKVFVHYASMAFLGVSDRYIVNKTIVNNTLKIEYFDFKVNYDQVKQLEDSKGNVIAKIGDNDNYRQLVENNINKFPKKEVTFKLINGVYKYDSEKDV